MQAIASAVEAPQQRAHDDAIVEIHFGISSFCRIAKVPTTFAGCLGVSESSGSGFGLVDESGDSNRRSEANRQPLVQFLQHVQFLKRVITAISG